MKKFLLLILFFAMFIPMFVNAETCDTDKISITSIAMESKLDSVEELDEASASGTNINLNLSMSEVGDNIKYKLIVKNDSNEDYLLNKNRLNFSSDYIEFTIDSEDNTNIVKANSSKVVYLNINYAKEVPDEVFESGTYNDKMSMTLNLSTSDILKNPNTGVQSYILFLFIIILISATTYLLLRKKKYTKFMILIIGIAIIIPISVYAICKVGIKIETNIIIKDNYVYTINNWDSSIDGYNNVWLEEDFPSQITKYNNGNETGKNIYLKHKVNNNKVIESYVEFVITEEFASAHPGMVVGKYKLRGLKTCANVSETWTNPNAIWTCKEEYIDSNGNCKSPYFESNKEVIKKAFGAIVDTNECYEDAYNYSCHNSGFFVGIESRGRVSVSDVNWVCDVSFDGNSSCN